MTTKNTDTKGKKKHSKYLLVALIKLIPNIVRDLVNGEEVNLTIKK